MICNINPRIKKYIDMVESGAIESCLEQKLLTIHIKKCFETEDIYTDDKQLENYLGLTKYFPYERLFEWEEFVFALHCCTYRRKDGMPRWPDLFMLIGRGAGKDGYIAFEGFCLITPYNGIPVYHVDICANSEEQAKAPFEDVYNVLDAPENESKLKKHFYWNKVEISSLKTKSKIKYRTNNPKGKDGLRSGIVIFNEIHQYQDYANINVFTTGLGKKKHPRRTYATTNGDVRDGPLDHMIERAEQILKGEISDNGMIPFICKLDSKDEVNDRKNWEKANPSLPHLPHLMEEISKEYDDWVINPAQLSAFMTKRMNIPDGNKEIQVTDWDNIAATKRPVPELKGRSATVGIDYMKVTDFASVNFHFREGDIRYDISHSWLCLNSADIPRLKIPWREWAAEDLLTLVDDVEISPDLIAEYIAEMAIKYNITMLSMDNFRYALLAEALKKVGFDATERKNIKLVRPSDIMKVVPIIDSCFAKQLFVWGDNPLLRWATNNTKLIPAGKKQGTDTGNFYYGKIEAKSRKTDPFMALVHSMVTEDSLGTGGSLRTPDIDVHVY